MSQAAFAALFLTNATARQKNPALSLMYSA